MTLMAQVEQARNRHQESNQQLLAASGVAKGIAAAAWIENRKLKKLMSTPRTINTSVKVRAGKWTDTDRTRAWKALADDPNSVLLDPQREEIRRRNGRGPRTLTPDGKWKVDELSHEPTPRQSGGDRVVPRTRIEHAAIDPDRKLKKGSDEQKLADALGQDQAARNRHNSLPADERARIEALRDARREAVWQQDGWKEYDPRKLASGVPQQGILRGAGKALGPIGVALDAYSLKEAWDADGGQWGENVTSTAGGVAGGWAGAAAGAAIGSAAGPVGTVIGGVIGGVIGSGIGSEIADEVGDVAAGIGEGIGDVAEGIGDLFD